MTESNQGKPLTSQDRTRLELTEKLMDVYERLADALTTLDELIAKYATFRGKKERLLTKRQMQFIADVVGLKGLTAGAYSFASGLVDDAADPEIANEVVKLAKEKETKGA